MEYSLERVIALVPDYLRDVFIQGFEYTYVFDVLCDEPINPANLGEYTYSTREIEKRPCIGSICDCYCVT